MQLLMVLFLIVFITILSIAVLLGLSYLVGMRLNATSGHKADAADKNPCAQWEADYTWYQTLPDWQQTVTIGWWWVNRFQANQKGC